MDTALITFMIQTSTSTQSVHLIGSWDNFTKRYPMERDIRRSRGQWRGCYAFEDIIYDGVGKSTSKRTGGLKMGATYYYYYEIDNILEHYDTSIPSTTSCPYLPGQPVNLLYVPTEIEPLRSRSASMTSLANSHLKTMNPAEKFMAPRQPPPLPLLPRLNTSPTPITHKRTARSLSPKVDRQWSARGFFGLRSPVPFSSEHNLRGRSSSLNRSMEKGLISETTTRESSETFSGTKLPSSPSRSPSPQTILRVRSRDPSPLRQSIVQEGGGYTTTTFMVPDEIAEEAEDDANFASELPRKSVHEKMLHTKLSPPPSARPTLLVRSLSDMLKPLPDLPSLVEQSRSNERLSSISTETDSAAQLIPHPLRLRPNQLEGIEPRSHFSISTVASSTRLSMDGSFDDTSFDDEESECTADLESGDDGSYSPVLDMSPVLSPGGFSGYSLPTNDYGSQHTLRKLSEFGPLSANSTRTTFGVTAFAPVLESSGKVEEEGMSSLELLMSEIRYLGDAIVR